jgi:hypothetical protein
MKFKLLIIFFLCIFLLGLASASLNVSLSDQGTNTRYKINGSLVNNVDLEVSIFDSLTGGNLIYNETFLLAVKNGSWNVMLGENSSNPLQLEFGKKYYKDYKINSEDLDFTDFQGAAVERQFFYSPLGDIAGEDVNATANFIISGLNLSNGNLTTTDYGFFHNVVATLNITAGWFNGLYNFVVGLIGEGSSIGYLIFNGSTLSFNESYLNNTLLSEGIRLGFNSTYNATYADYSSINLTSNIQGLLNLTGIYSTPLTINSTYNIGVLYNDTALLIAQMVNSTAQQGLTINSTLNIGTIYNATASMIANLTFLTNFTLSSIGSFYNTTAGIIANKTFLTNFTLSSIGSFYNATSLIFAQMNNNTATLQMLLNSTGIYSLPLTINTTLNIQTLLIGTNISQFAFNQTLETFNAYNSTWDNSWINSYNNTWYNHTLSTIGILSSNFTQLLTINSTLNIGNLYNATSLIFAQADNNTASLQLKLNSSYVFQGSSNQTKVSCSNITGGSDADFCADATGASLVFPIFINDSFQIYNNLSYPSYINLSGILYVNKTSGNVGIGTTSPNRILTITHVHPEIQFNNTGYPSNTWHIGVTVGDFAITETNVATRLYIQNTSGNVGIGTTSPSSKLEVKGTSPSIQVMDSGETQNWYFGINETDNSNLYIGAGYGPAQGIAPVITLRSSLGGGTYGRVGIGTTSPTSTLHVVGSANFSNASTIYYSPNVSDTTLGVLHMLLNPSGNLGGVQTGWTDVNVSTYVPAGTKGVYLQMRPIATAAGTAQVNILAGVRKNGGTATHISYVGNTINPAITGTVYSAFGTVSCEVDTTYMIEYANDGSGSSARSVEIYVLGYYI